MARIAVVIPAFNCVDTIGEAVSSLTQTYSDIEVLVVTTVQPMAHIMRLSEPRMAIRDSESCGKKMLVLPMRSILGSVA